jgi:hypothetical protein
MEERGGWGQEATIPCSFALEEKDEREEETMETAASGISSSPTDQSTADAKIQADLNVLKEKMDLCESLLPSATAMDDGFMGVVGFLEACSPRVVELVEAAAQGALGEEILMECLAVNDRLTTLLTKTDAKLPPVGDNVPAVAAAITPAGSSAVTAESEDLLFQVSDAPAPPANAKTTGEEDPFAPSTASAKTTGEEDPFGNQVLASTPSNDEFDDFFQQRTAK